MNFQYFKAFNCIFSIWGRNSKVYEAGGGERNQRTGGGKKSKVTQLYTPLGFLLLIFDAIFLEKDEMQLFSFQRIQKRLFKSFHVVS